MSMIIRPEVSRKNKYWIDKCRHYELKYFCLQYHQWRREYRELDGLSQYINDEVNDHNDPTYDIAAKRLSYSNKMRLVEQTAIAADANIYEYILKGVTEGRSYNYMKTVLNIPCGKDLYYDRCRRFFWLLDKARD